MTELLKKAGLTKAELARRLKITPQTVSNWKEDPPGYAVAYLELLIERNCYAEFVSGKFNEKFRSEPKSPYELG